MHEVFVHMLGALKSFILYFTMNVRCALDIHSVEPLECERGTAGDRDETTREYSLASFPGFTVLER